MASASEDCRAANPRLGHVNYVRYSMTVNGPVGSSITGTDELIYGQDLLRGSTLQFSPVPCDTRISHGVGRNMPLSLPQSSILALRAKLTQPTAHQATHSLLRCPPTTVTPHFRRPAFSTYIDRSLQVSYHLARKTGLYYSDKLFNIKGCSFQTLPSTASNTGCY
jgi:hypothetical protein